MVTLYTLMLKKPDGRSVSLGDPSEYPTMAMHIQKELSPYIVGAELKVEEMELDEASYMWAKNMAHNIMEDKFRCFFNNDK